MPKVHGGTSELDLLVQRTRGAQPIRRVFHATNGLAIALALESFHLSHGAATASLAALFAMLATVDLLRLRHAGLNRAFFKAFARLASPREAGGFASSTWYALGVLITLAAFPRSAAVSGILVLALADPAASYVGRRWGRRPFLGGTLEGTTVFVIVALTALLFRHSLLVATIASLASGAAERLSWPLDDNLILPVVTAAAVTLLEVLS